MIFGLAKEKDKMALKNLGNGYCTYSKENVNIYGDYFNFGNVELYLFPTINMAFIIHYDNYYHIYIPFIIEGSKINEFFKELRNDIKYLVGWKGICEIDKQNCISIQTIKYRIFYFAEFLCWLFQKEII